MARLCYSQILLCSLSVFSFLIPESQSSPWGNGPVPVPRSRITFNLANIRPQHQNVYITPFQDSYISTKGLQVTSDEKNINMQQRTGKATYSKPLHLWDAYTGSLADFETHFTFVIDSDGRRNFADGLAFFLAPEGSNSTAGGAMGLPINPVTIEPTTGFVAVEFDTFPNGWDPLGTTPVTHVGINVKSLKSSVTAPWNCDIARGKENEAWISYDASSHTLTVRFTGYIGEKKVEDSISFVVDLRDYLPERVRFGFSAATGAWFEKHTVRSWEFSSSFASKETTAVASSKEATAVAASSEDKTAVEKCSWEKWINWLRN